MPLTNCVHQSLKRGHLEVVGWLLQRGHRPHQKVVDRLCAQGRLEDLVWFNSRGVEISQRGVEKNQVQVIERGIFPTKNYVENISISLLDPHLLKFFLAKGLRPSQKSIDDYYQKYTGRYANLRTFQSKIELLLETKLLPGERK